MGWIRQNDMDIPVYLLVGSINLSFCIILTGIRRNTKMTGAAY